MRKPIIRETAVRRVAFVACTILAVLALLPRSDRAHAEAALAIGIPEKIADQGLAIGWALNYPNKEAAQAEALKRCRGYMDAPQATRDLCRVVESFRQRCLAVALDPDKGTTGLGWAVARRQQEAEDLAMDRCIDTSAKNRRDFCRVTLTRCDGKN